MIKKSAFTIFPIDEETKKQDSPPEISLAVQEVFENVDDLTKFTAKEVENLKKASNKERIEMIKRLLKFTKGAALTSKDADELE